MQGSSDGKKTEDRNVKKTKGKQNISYWAARSLLLLCRVQSMLSSKRTAVISVIKALSQHEILTDYAAPKNSVKMIYYYT